MPLDMTKPLSPPLWGWYSEKQAEVVADTAKPLAKFIEAGEREEEVGVRCHFRLKVGAVAVYATPSGEEVLCTEVTLTPDPPKWDDVIPRGPVTRFLRDLP